MVHGAMRMRAAASLHTGTADWRLALGPLAAPAALQSPGKQGALLPPPAARRVVTWCWTYNDEADYSAGYSYR